MARDLVEHLPLYAYGHSYLASDNACSPGARYIHRVRDRHNMTLINHSANGYYMSDACLTAMAGRDQWTIGSDGIVVVDAAVADFVYAGGGTVARRRFENALRSLLSLLTARAFYDEDSHGFSYSGAWTRRLDAAALRGGTYTTTTTPDDHVDITFEGDEVTLLTTGFQASIANNASFTIEHDETTLDTYTSQDEATPHGLVRQSFVNKVVPLSGFGAGTHTIRVAHAGSLGHWLTIDGILIPSETPPAVLVMMPLYLQTLGYAYGEIGSVDSTVDAYAALIPPIVADYANARAVDARPGWDPYAMTSGIDGAHPNDRGHAHIANVIDAVLGSLDLHRGQSRLRSTDAGLGTGDQDFARPEPPFRAPRTASADGLRGAESPDQNAAIRSFRARARGRVARELRDGHAFVSDVWKSSRLRGERWFVIGDSNAYILRPVRNALLRLRSTTLHRIGQPGEAERTMAAALQWQEPQGTAIGTLIQALGRSVRFPMPTEADVAVISYGEIDMRTHVHPQVFEMNRSLDDVLDEIAACAVTLMEHYERSFPGRTAFLAVKGPVGEFENPDYPCPASISQRAEWTAELNRRIVARTAERSFARVGIADWWEVIVRPDGTMPPELSDDYVHLKQSCFRIVRDSVRQTVARLSASGAAQARESLGAATPQAP